MATFQSIQVDTGSGRSTVSKLREKLNHPACLKTIRSFGYRMEDTQ